MKLKKIVDEEVQATKVELRRKIREDSQRLPGWLLLFQAFQQGSRDADLMDRLSC